MSIIVSSLFLLGAFFIVNSGVEEIAMSEQKRKKEKEIQLLDAVVQGDCQKVSFLLSDFSVKGSGLLCMAILKKQMDMARLLIKYNIDINAMFDNLWPLQIAVETENMDAVGILLNANVNVNAVDGYGSTVLHFLPDSASDICNRLMRAGASPAIANLMGLTPLHNAAIKGFNNIIDELCVCKGVAIDAKDCNGRTPLHYALLYSHESVALKLIDFGAKVNTISKLYESPFDIADDNNLENAKRALRKKGAYSCQLPYGNIYDNAALKESLMIGRVKS